jgi:hypothetical protein
MRRIGLALLLALVGAAPAAAQEVTIYSSMPLAGRSGGDAFDAGVRART